MKAHKNLQKGMYLFQTNKFYHIFRYFTRGFLWFSFGHNEVSPVNVTFLSPNKKVTKEIGTGKALCVALPRAKAALPYEPIPAALGQCGGTQPRSSAQQKCSDFCCAEIVPRKDGRTGVRSLLQMFFSAILSVQPLRNCAAMAMRTGEVHRRGCI